MNQHTYKIETSTITLLKKKRTVTDLFVCEAKKNV